MMKQEQSGGISDVHTTTTTKKNSFLPNGPCGLVLFPAAQLF